MTVRWDILNDFTDAVGEERDRQVRKFGDQAGEELNLPFVHRGQNPHWFAAEARNWQEINRIRFHNGGRGAWDGILLEEVFEALAEEDPEKMEVELVQVAAVACAMYEASVRNRETAEDRERVAERERRAAGKARFDRILEETAEAREARAVEHVEELFPSPQRSAYDWLESNGFTIQETVDLPEGTMFMFEAPASRTRPTEGASFADLFGPEEPYAYKVGLETDIAPGVDWEALCPDPFLGTGEESQDPLDHGWTEIGHTTDPFDYLDPEYANLRRRAQTTYFFPRVQLASNLSDDRTSKIDTLASVTLSFNAADVNPEVRDLLFGGTGRMMPSRAECEAQGTVPEEIAPIPAHLKHLARPETRPFGSCCPHPALDPDPQDVEFGKSIIAQEVREAMALASAAARL